MPVIPQKKKKNTNKEIKKKELCAIHQAVQKHDNDANFRVAYIRETREGHHSRNQLLGCNLFKKCNVEKLSLLGFLNNCGLPRLLKLQAFSTPRCNQSLPPFFIAPVNYLLEQPLRKYLQKSLIKYTYHQY